MSDFDSEEEYEEAYDAYMIALDEHCDMYEESCRW